MSLRAASCKINGSACITWLTVCSEHCMLYGCVHVCNSLQAKYNVYYTTCFIVLELKCIKAWEYLQIESMLGIPKKMFFWYQFCLDILFFIYTRCPEFCLVEKNNRRGSVMRYMMLLLTLSVLLLSSSFI